MSRRDIEVMLDDPYTDEAIALMDELSGCLQTITGNGGQNSFDASDVCAKRAAFAVARNGQGEAVGCGAFRPLDEDTAELKRMYARTKGEGVGNKILAYLENLALQMGYRSMCLETRQVNTKAVQFYERNGYVQIPNYGRYAGREEAVCFQKDLDR